MIFIFRIRGRTITRKCACFFHQAAPPLYKASSFSVPTAQPSSIVKQPASIALATGPSSTVTGENMQCDSPRPQRKTVQVSENVLSGLTQVREDLYRIEDNQMTFIDQLEVRLNCICIKPQLHVETFTWDFFVTQRCETGFSRR